MRQLDPFESAPDPALGRLLREHLDPDDHEAFVTRVLAAIGAAHPVAGYWEFVVRWSRPGIAAAVLLAAGLALGVGSAFREETEPVSLAEAISPAETAADVLTAQAPPGAALALTSMLEQP